MEFHLSKLSDSKFWVKYTSREKSYLKEVHANYVRPEKFQFMEKGKNCNFNYKIVITVKKIRN